MRVKPSCCDAQRRPYQPASAALILAAACAILALGCSGERPARRSDVPSGRRGEASSGAASPDESTSPSAVQRELLELEKRLGRSIAIIDVPRVPGRVDVRPDQGITVDDLRGVTLDDDPPMRARGRPNAADDGARPYEAPGIAPFRLEHFHAEFNWSGWPKLCKAQNDYAAAHGFDAVFHRDESSPPGTGKVHWGHMLDWPTYFRERGVTWGRWDQLAERDVFGEILPRAWDPVPDAVAMADLEHPWPLKAAELRKQPWYPAHGSEREREEFERRYYHGFALSHTAVMEALRHKGWKTVGVYPQAYTATWYPLLSMIEHDPETAGLPNPATHEVWQNYGREITLSQDVLYPDHYVFYWSPQNAAYVTAQNDYDLALVNSLPEAQRRPYRPYYWPLLHGGDAEHHWWRYQPLPVEDMRAMFFFVFFSGCDGVVLWNFSERDDSLPPKLEECDYWRDHKPGARSVELMLSSGFEARPIGALADTKPTRFERYDMLAVTRVDLASGSIRFQRIDTSQKEAWQFERTREQATYAMKIDEALAHVRRNTDTVAGAVEGLALAKAFESFLHEGDVAIDRPAIRQFARSEPLVRRMSWGSHHLIATYDARCVYRRSAPGSVTLDDFGGVSGRTLVLPADGHVRLFVIRED